MRADAKENAEYGELSEAVREAYRIVAYGDGYQDRDRLQQQLQRAKSEYERQVEEKERVESRMDDVEARIRRLRDQLETIESQEDRYEEELQELEEQVRNGAYIFPDHAGVQRAAETAGMDPNQVIDDLQERNPDVPPRAFEAKHKSERAWNGVESEPK